MYTEDTPTKIWSIKVVVVEMAARLVLHKRNSMAGTSNGLMSLILYHNGQRISFFEDLIVKLPGLFADFRYNFIRDAKTGRTYG
jgi:hypothetical protein